MIVINRLVKRYGRVRAVDELSFEATPGRVTAFLGPNGAGKTTSLRILLGVTPAEGGSATIDGRPYRALTEPVRQVGALIGSSTFHPGRTGRTHLRALALAAGLPAGRVEQVLGEVDLDGAADRRVGGYSSGMRQRLGLAGALLGDPRAVVLDEPQNGLDPHGVRWLRTFLRGLADEGRTVLVASHVLGEMERIADDVVIVDRGAVVHCSPLGELRGDGTSLEDLFLQLTGRTADSEEARS